VSWDTVLPRNFGIPLPSDIVPYPRRRESFKDTLLVAVTTGVIVIKTKFVCVQCRAGVGGVGAFKAPPPEIPKALQNRAKLNPIVKTVKNCRN